MTSLIAGAGANSIAHAEPSALVCHDPDDKTKEIFRPYRVFCARKDVSFFFFLVPSLAPFFLYKILLISQLCFGLLVHKHFYITSIDFFKVNRIWDSKWKKK